MHGEFGKWLESVEINHNTANRFMKIVEELPNSTTLPNLVSERYINILNKLGSNVDTYQHLGLRALSEATKIITVFTKLLSANGSTSNQINTRVSV